MKKDAVVFLSAALRCLCSVHVTNASVRIVPSAKTLSERAAQMDAFLLIRVVGNPIVRAVDITSTLEERNRMTLYDPVVFAVTEYSADVLEVISKRVAGDVGPILRLGKIGGEATWADTRLSTRSGNRISYLAPNT